MRQYLYVCLIVDVMIFDEIQASARPPECCNSSVFVFPVQ